MDLKPENILEIEFSRSFRGYNEDEVNEFIEEIAEAVEAVLKEKEKLLQENEEYRRKVNELSQYAKRLEGNLDEWKKQLEIEKELTRRESQMHLKEAQIRGNRIVDEALKKRKKSRSVTRNSKKNIDCFRFALNLSFRLFLIALTGKSNQRK